MAGRERPRALAAALRDYPAIRDHELLARELEGAPGVARDPTAVYSALGRIEVAMARFLLPPRGAPGAN